MPKKKKEKVVEVVGLLGVGLDNHDGHQRLTRGENFILVGGSEKTHERMTETALRFNEKLRAQRKPVEEMSPDELADWLD